jgi:hypothetical protein
LFVIQIIIPTITTTTTTTLTFYIFLDMTRLTGLVIHFFDRFLVSRISFKRICSRTLLVMSPHFQLTSGSVARHLLPNLSHSSRDSYRRKNLKRLSILSNKNHRVLRVKQRYTHRWPSHLSHHTFSFGVYFLSLSLCSIHGWLCFV